MATWYAVVFLFIFSLILAGANLLFTAHLVNKASANSASIVQLCEQANSEHAKQVRLWTYIVAFTPPPAHETSAQRAQRLKVSVLFLAHVRQIFAPRNCTHN